MKHLSLAPLKLLPFSAKMYLHLKLHENLSDEAYKSLSSSIKGGKKIDRAVASQIANGIRAWAEAKGRIPFYALVSAINGNHCRKA